MKLFYIIFTIVLLSTGYLSAQTQNDACTTVINDGEKLFKSGQYIKAKERFEAAKKRNCDKAQSWIDQCNEKLKPGKSSKQIQCEQYWKDGKEAYDSSDYETALIFLKKGLDKNCNNAVFLDYIELCNMKLTKQKIVREQPKLADENNQTDLIPEIPIIITSLKIGNVYRDGTVETQYGSKLYSSTSMYLKPQIEFIGLQKCESIKLYTKLYQDGTLRSNSKTSPPGYTSQSGNIFVSGQEKQTKDFAAWGSATPGFFPVGDYRYEIWYDETLLNAIDFKLY
ncbi:MAG: hypothetical protein LBJ67_07985 [Planctomycetaceae bacterium]|jgi:tetratricopeptide (TPR) repeat protein|nr:hypothetical protein [Planctomycetaceae bacterium]